jgi:enoyl-CoA hydratase/carnithine racemase
MNFSFVDVERDGAALTIKFKRPEKRNAISKAVMDDFIAAVESVDDDPDIFGIIIAGHPNFFSAGADLNEALVEQSTPALGVKYMAKWRKFNSTLENSSKPVIAAVEGFCMTGGFELILACDLRIAAENATFAITSAKIGTVPGAGATQRLPRLAGIGNALEILFAAEPIDVHHAYRVNLINKVVPVGEALNEAKRIVQVYATRGPLSLKLLKRAVYRGMQMPINEALEFESFVVNTIYQSKDKQEGITAFLEKRKAVFKGE